MINRRAFLSLSLVLAGCGGGGGAGPVEARPEAVGTQSSLPLQSGAYQQLGGPIFDGTYVVEATYYPTTDGSYSLFFQCEDLTACVVPDFAANPAKSGAARVLPGICRFPFVFQDRGAHFLVCGHQSGGGDVYLYRSSDLRTWVIQNGGEPIVRQVPGTQWANVWNVTVVPDGTRWHLLAETASGQPDSLGIAYAWADPAVSVDFTPNQGPLVIPRGGNPEAFLKNGKLVAVHGVFQDHTHFGGKWYTTVSTADPSNPTAWTTHRDRLLIGQDGVDVADPTYMERDGFGRIAVSYAQDKVIQLRGPLLEP